MIVLRSSLFSKKSKKVALKDIPHGFAGLGTSTILAPSMGEITGRKAGMDEADRLDSLGKSDIEIIEGASKEAKKAGKVAGGAVGLTLGVPLGVWTNKTMKEISEQAKDVNRLAKTGKALKKIGTAGKTLAKLPVIGKKYLHGKKESYTTGKILRNAGKGAKKASGGIDKVIRNSDKISKYTKRGAIPAAIGAAGLSTLYGVSTGGRRGARAAERNTIVRLGKRHNLEENNSKSK